MIKSTVQNFIEKYKLSGTFIVAFSGGYDSMCLLDVLNKLGYNPVAIHLNHNWRGSESDCEEEICRKFCKKNNIEFYSEKLSEDVPKTETAARNARYAFFEKCAKKFNSDVIFTAHNFNDNAETVLYRIIKGTGTIGLRGISEKRDIFYRPLLNIKRKDIEDYCRQNDLSPNSDSSNENTKYKRNLIRNKIIPMMQEINPNVLDAINSLVDIAKEDFSFANSDKYMIRDLLVSNNIDYDRKKIENIQKFITENKKSKSGKTLSLTSDLWLFVSEKELKIISKPEKINTEIMITQEGEYRFENFIFSITKAGEKISEFPKDSEFKAYVNISDIDFCLRHRIPGDIITPLGSSGKQKLKKYLNEKKIPNYQKDFLVLLCKNNEVLWAAGVGLSDKIKVLDKPTHIIELRGANE